MTEKNSYTTTSNEQGNYTFEKIEAEGNYQIIVAHDEYTSWSDEFYFEEGSDIKTLNITLSKGAKKTVKVSGKVTDAKTGNAMGNVVVKHGTMEYITNEDGYFVLDGFPSVSTPQKYDIIFYYNSYDSLFEKITKQVTISNIDITDFDVAVKLLNSKLKGQVVIENEDEDEEGIFDIIPIANATVTIGNQVAVTDENGEFSIDNVPLGGQTVLVSKKGYYNTDFFDYFEKDAVLERVYTLEEELYPIDGNITCGDEFIKDALVGNEYDFTFTDMLGHYTLYSKKGDTHVKVIKRGYVTSEKEFTVSDTSSVDDHILDFELTKSSSANSSIKFKVVDAGNLQKIQDASVSIADSVLVTDANGECTIDKLNLGEEYHALVRIIDYEDEELDVTPEDSLKTYTVQLHKDQFKVSGTVKDNNNAKVANAEVYIQKIFSESNETTKYIPTTVTDDNGYFEVSHVPCGDYNLKIVKKDIVDNITDFTVENDTSLNITVNKGYTLKCIVTDNLNQFRHKSNTKCLLDDTTELEIDEFGRVEVGLSSGAHSLKFTSDDCEDKLVEFTMTADKELEVQLTQNTEVVNIYTVDQNNAPVEDVEIFVRNGRRDLFGPFMTDEDGHCSVTITTADNLDNMVYLNKQGYQDLSNTLSCDDTHIVMFPSSQNQTVKVKVSQKDANSVISDADVILEGRHTLRKRPTDSFGIAIFNNLDNSDFICTITKSGYIKKIDKVYVQENNLENSIQLEKGYTISGTVLDDDKNKPILFSFVELYTNDDEKTLVNKAVVNNTTGYYKFDEVKPGNYTLKFNNLSSLFEEVVHNITLNQNSTVNKEISLGTHKINVKLKQSSIEGWTNIIKKLAWEDYRNSRWLVTLEDENGRIVAKNAYDKHVLTFNNVPNGDYIVNVHSPALSKVRGGFKKVTVNNNDVNVVFDLQDIHHVTLHGYVQDLETLECVGNAKVKVTVKPSGSSSTMSFETYTNRDGYYFFSGIYGKKLEVFEGFNNFSFKLEVTAPNYADKETSYKVIDIPSYYNFKNNNLEISGYDYGILCCTNYNVYIKKQNVDKELKVTVEDIYGDIVEDAKVVCQGKTLSLDEDGVYSAVGFEEGDYWLNIITSPDSIYLPQRKKISLGSKKNYEFNITLEELDEVEGLGNLCILGHVDALANTAKESLKDVTSCDCANAKVSCEYDFCESDDKGYYSLFVTFESENSESFKEINQLVLRAEKSEYESQVFDVSLKSVYLACVNPDKGYFNQDFTIKVKYNEKVYNSTLRYLVSEGGFIPLSTWLSNNSSWKKNFLIGNGKYIEKPINTHGPSEISTYEPNFDGFDNNYPLVIKSHNKFAHFKTLPYAVSNRFFEGLVIDEKGYPVEDAKVDAWVSKDRHYVTYTNKKGEFYIVSPEFPTYSVKQTNKIKVNYRKSIQITVEKSGYIPASHVEGQDKGVQTHDNYPFALFRLENHFYDEGTVKVTVRNKLHKFPLAFAAVALKGSTPLAEMTSTNFDGKCDFNGVLMFKTSDPFLLTVVCPGYYPEKIPFSFEDSFEKEFVIDLEPKPLRTVSGNVLRKLKSENIPIKNVDVVIGNRIVKTDDEGYFKTQVYTDESYLTVHAPGCKPCMFALNDEATLQDVHITNYKELYNKINFAFLGLAMGYNSCVNANYVNEILSFVNQIEDNHDHRNQLLEKNKNAEKMIHEYDVKWSNGLYNYNEKRKWIHAWENMPLDKARKKVEDYYLHSEASKSIIFSTPANISGPFGTWMRPRISKGIHNNLELAYMLSKLNHDKFLMPLNYIHIKPEAMYDQTVTNNLLTDLTFAHVTKSNVEDSVALENEINKINETKATMELWQKYSEGLKESIGYTKIEEQEIKEKYQEVTGVPYDQGPNITKPIGVQVQLLAVEAIIFCALLLVEKICGDKHVTPPSRAKGTPKWHVPVMKNHEDILMVTVTSYNVSGNVWDNTMENLQSGVILLDNSKPVNINGFFNYPNVPVGYHTLTFKSANDEIFSEEILVEEDTFVDLRKISGDNDNETGVVYEIIDGEKVPVKDAEVHLISVKDKESLNFEKVGNIAGKVLGGNSPSVFSALSGVSVSCRSLENSNKYFTTTNSNGQYSFKNLKVGSYQLTFEKENFYADKKAEEKVLKVQVVVTPTDVNHHVTVDAKLFRLYKKYFIFTVDGMELATPEIPEIIVDGNVIPLNQRTADGLSWTYVVKLLAGSHNLKVTHSLCEDVNKTFSVASDSSVNYELTLKKGNIKGRTDKNVTVRLLYPNGDTETTESDDFGFYSFEDVNYGAMQIHSELESDEEGYIDNTFLDAPNLTFNFKKD